jgi:non-specific serine/threonine protein kinase
MQRLFRALSVFAGSVMPQSAHYVSGDDAFPPATSNPAEDPSPYDLVLSTCVLLAENSLLVRGDDFGLSPRFSLLMTIRTFGQTLLKDHGEWETVRQRHAEWFHSMALRAAAELTGPRHVVWLDWLDIEHENLRSALDWFHQRRDIHAFASLVGSLREFWHRRSHIGEGARWLQLALDMDEVEGGEIDLADRANLLNSAGWMALRQNRIDAFRSFAEESLEVARASGDMLQIASSLRLFGEVEDRSTDYAKATLIVREANQIYRAAGDLVGIADTQASLGGLALDSGDLERAVALFREGIDAAKSAGDLHMQSRVTSALSVTLFETGDFEEGLALSEQTLVWYEETGDIRGKAVALDHIGRYLRAMGDPVRAWFCHQESLDHRWKFGETRGLVVWLETVNELLLSCDGHAASACVLGGTDRMRERAGLPIHNHEQRGRQEMLRQLERRLSPGDMSVARARGANMALRELVDYTWSATDRAVNERARRHADKPTSFGRFDLTRREQEIAELLILRQSDREISDRLSISPRTVNAHITRILNKLGVHSRREVGQVIGDENQ